MPRPPRGIVGLREAEYRLAHPGQHLHRQARSSRWERAVTTWMDILVSDILQERDISPWDALLLNVQKSWARVMWVDVQLNEAVRQADGDMNAPVVTKWLNQSRKERALCGRIAQAAVHAGVAERLVAQVELDGQLLLRVMTVTLDELHLDEEQRLVAITTMQRELLAIEGPEDLRPSPGPGLVIQAGEAQVDEPIHNRLLGADQDPEPGLDQPAESDLEPGTRRTEQPREHPTPLATAIDPQDGEPEVWPASRPEDGDRQRRMDGR